MPWWGYWKITIFTFKFLTNDYQSSSQRFPAATSEDLNIIQTIILTTFQKVSLKRLKEPTGLIKVFILLSSDGSGSKLRPVDYTLTRCEYTENRKIQPRDRRELKQGRRVRQREYSYESVISRFSNHSSIIPTRLACKLFTKYPGIKVV